MLFLVCNNSAMKGAAGYFALKVYLLSDVMQVLSSFAISPLRK